VHFKKALSKTLPDLVEFQPRLRVSGFPFCGLKAAWKKITNHVEPDADALKSFYCDIGTAVHTVLQRFVGSLGKMYGNWLCLNKRCKHVVKFSPHINCPKCGSEMLYEEFSIKAFRHVSGHTDGLFKDKYGKFWIVDYKTTSVSVIESQKDKPTLPYQKNKAQILAYVALLELELNIEISGWMLVYVARDKPTVFKVTGGFVDSKTKNRILKKIRLYDKQYETVLNLDSHEKLDYLVSTKACKSHEYYKKHLEGFEPCPLEPVCFGNQLQPLLDTTMQDFIDKTVNIR